MSRFIDPAPHYTRAGIPLTNGTIAFFESGTTTPKQTYADENESIPNPLVISLDTSGYVPNIFFSGTAKVVVTDDSGQLFERDPVGGEKELGDFSLWLSVVDYDKGDIVEGSDGLIYRSLTNNNIGNDPTLSQSTWEEIRFISVYNPNKQYIIGEVCQTSDGDLWRSLVGSNASNDPLTDDGSNWEPANRQKQVIPHTGGGQLTALRNNELRDGSTYTIPSASTVKVNDTITISLPDRYSANEPLVQVTGGDSVTDVDGADTEILFNSGSVEIILTSDSVSNWSL